MPDQAQDTFEPESDSELYGWQDMHPSGYVLSVRKGKPPLLHKSGCGHIITHNNPNALTQRGMRKICAETKNLLRDWVRENGLGSGIVLDRCRSCSP
jgi:hypothetical protein